MTATNNYETRKQARIARYEQLAKKNENVRVERVQAGVNKLSVIPMGQPILIGHHSEKKHRAHLKRVDNDFRAACVAEEKAKYYQHKAEAARNNRAISSDDPEAVTKLKEKIASLEGHQQKMKDANKIVKSKKLTDEQKIEQLTPIVGQHSAPKLLLPDFCGRVGFPSYALQNNNANIRRLKKRLEQLEARAHIETKEIETGDTRIVQNAEDNRTQIFFPDIPSADVRTELKRNGFRWSRFNGCWQRHLSAHALRIAERIVKERTQ